MHKFTIYWLDGTKSTVTGPTFYEARAAVYGTRAGITKAIDFHACGEPDDSYKWNGKTWTKSPQVS